MHLAKIVRKGGGGGASGKLFMARCAINCSAAIDPVFNIIQFSILHYIAILSK